MNTLLKTRLLFSFLILFVVDIHAQKIVYVATNGNDLNPGTYNKPLASFAGAQQYVQRINTAVSVKVIFKDGIYYLPNTVRFTNKDTRINNIPVYYSAEHPGKVIISGGKRITPDWKPFKNGIYVTSISSETDIDQLYLNGVRQEMARYPNSVINKNVFDAWDLTHNPIRDSLADVLLPSRVATWRDPSGGFVHAMHAYLWGDMHWLIKKTNEQHELELEGGWQNNRPSPMHPVFRIAENIFEELDAPGEWFFDKTEKKLYYIPHHNINLKQAVVEIVRLKHLIEFNGTMDKPISNIHLNGFVFRHTARTFMENKERLLRSDWTIYRGGAIVYNGAENCEIIDCEFDQVGGNTILVNNYNKNIKVKGCYIHHSGASGVVFVGDTNSIRNPLFGYQPQAYENLDMTKGPKTKNYPTDCLVEDCIITMTGRVEKQTAPIQISMAHKIRVNHCSIYDVPRAGINISEGAFGGHIIENSDIFNTVLETGDHGSFNSWGRDRYWSPDQQTVHVQVDKNRSLPFLDILEPNIIRNNRWRCDHGWDIDLDDGSSHYRIYNNLLLKGGLKLREGYDRIVTNNVIINNTFHPHVWFENSDDVIKHNIVFEKYNEIMMDNTVGINKKWGKEIDSNFFVCDGSQMKQFLKNGADSNSMNGDPLFIDPIQGDFRVKSNSTALAIGFTNFDMQSFGVIKPALKAIAKTPLIPSPLYRSIHISSASNIRYLWMDILLSEPKGEALSAFGVGFGESGVALGNVEKESTAYQMGFRTGDLIMFIDGKKVEHIEGMKKVLDDLDVNKETYKINIIRNQKGQNLLINKKPPLILEKEEI
ncbi:MAG: right-handed parallel beta-helix repeat-containing protein [bacterium]